MKALIIDDEPIPAKHLSGLIKKHCFEITSTHIIHSPVKAIEHLKKNYYDLIFLDVEMPEINGFEVLEDVDLPNETQVIFTTAYSQYAIDAFKANATHYILKLVTKEELIVSVRRAQSRLLCIKDKENESYESISVFDGKEYLIINQKDVIRLEGDSGYTKIIVEGNKHYLSTNRIGYYNEQLNHKRFIRCHYSHIVNLSKIVKIAKGKPNYVVLSNDELIPVSNSRKEELRKRIMH